MSSRVSLKFIIPHPDFDPGEDNTFIISLECADKSPLSEIKKELNPILNFLRNNNYYFRDENNNALTDDHKYLSDYGIKGSHTFYVEYEKKDSILWSSQIKYIILTILLICYYYNMFNATKSDIEDYRAHQFPLQCQDD